MTDNDASIAAIARLLFQAHPWHGIEAGSGAPTIVNGYIEIVPTDVVKYELHKPSGVLMIDRPQRFSSVCPMPYGFVPQTYCGPAVAACAAARTGKAVERGDGDPLDICVLTEKPITHGNVLVRAKPIGGLLMIDAGEADDKVLAVLEGDIAYGHMADISECPPGLVERLRHYFLTYKQLPGAGTRRVEIASVYGAGEAHDVIRRSMADYREAYGTPEERFLRLRHALGVRPNKAI